MSHLRAAWFRITGRHRLARVVLKYGKDEKMRNLALDVIREQNARSQR